jgi:hypothetical protein
MGSRMRLAALVAAAAAGAAAAGCAGIGHEKVAGWPRLVVVEHYVPHAEMRSRCSRYVVRFGARPLACAQFDFAAGRCDIWYSAELGRRPDLIEHERLHCAGYDHPGEQAMKRMLAAWHRQQVFSARLTPDKGGEEQ